MHLLTATTETNFSNQSLSVCDIPKERRWHNANFYKPRPWKFVGRSHLQFKRPMLVGLLAWSLINNYIDPDRDGQIVMSDFQQHSDGQISFLWGRQRNVKFFPCSVENKLHRLNAI